MKLHIQRQAKDELTEAANWYQRNASRGADFMKEISDAIQFILEYPELWPVKKHNCRQSLTGRYPFSIVYRIVNETVIIVAVMHTSREPEYWKERL